MCKTKEILNLAHDVDLKYLIGYMYHGYRGVYHVCMSVREHVHGISTDDTKYIA